MEKKSPDECDEVTVGVTPELSVAVGVTKVNVMPLCPLGGVASILSGQLPTTGG